MPRGQAGAQHAPCCGGGCVMNARSFSTLETLLSTLPASVQRTRRRTRRTAIRTPPHTPYRPRPIVHAMHSTAHNTTPHRPKSNTKFTHAKATPHTQSATNYTTTTTTTTTTTYVHRHIHFSPLIHPGASFSSSLPHLPPRHLLVTSSPVPHCTKRPDLNGVPPDGGVHARPDGG